MASEVHLIFFDILYESLWQIIKNVLPEKQ